MDALTAHLDRGWDLLKNNDFRAAEISANKALEAESDSPEALTLLGAIAAAQGEDDDALEYYRKAMDSDPEYVSPMLYAAEVLLGPDGDVEQALKLAEDAVKHAVEEDEILDARLLHAEALIAFGDRDGEAKTVLSELPSGAFPDVVYHYRAARCFLDVGVLDAAEEHLRRTLAKEPDNADAYHALGLVYEQRDDHRAMVKAWLKVRELDLAEDPFPWALSADEFEQVAEEALGELPDRIRKLLENVPILASDYPSVEIVAEGNDPRMMGFFSGVPYPEKSNVAGSSPHLDSVFLYQRNIERVCRNRDEVQQEIRVTLLHETGHFFGLSEEELEAMGLG